MTPRAPATNSPLRKKEERKLAEIEALKAKFVAEGMTDTEAQERAYAEMRANNPTASWRK